ncbi:two-component system sensor histidine kinase CreC [Atlantibacter hermannii]|uniref:two-component system sensor histidine kinase CreC n=1 Tax=Atlantibacter hermannii TaxID=565 RepID=UPI001C706B94|nr:two-component system sensor histidine kinase CreC [Atlantibacter hermannii]MBW9429994.1 two-component system sensor histidine kinase CreC [Atlantibacter hermannii]
MRIGMRLLLGYFLIVAVAAWFVISIFGEEIKPGVRRATEGMLNDSATLLAEIARDDLLSGQPAQGNLARAFARLNNRPINANISGIVKNKNEYRVYLTDAAGKVVYDSSGQATGQDYSRWNDVWLTLRGEYGARSSQRDPNDPQSTVMYVAAPVRDNGRIIGVLTVGKPNSAMEPVIRRSQRRILIAGAILLGIALLIGLGVALWINRSIGKLVRYAEAVTHDRPVQLPDPGSSELRKLAYALEEMRIRLEGKNYIEHYVHALTHELKSPLAAIRGAAEILREAPPPDVIARFSENILQQNARMQVLIEKLLQQAKLENKLEIELRPVALPALFNELIENHQTQALTRQITLSVETKNVAGVAVAGDRDLLCQAISCLIDNALDFTPPGGTVSVHAQSDGDSLTIFVTDNGSGIPDFALQKVFERFYSLPRASGLKSSGLGLAFVQEVARLHRGAVTLCNRPEGGAEASIRLPRA